MKNLQIFGYATPADFGKFLKELKVRAVVAIPLGILSTAVNHRKTFWASLPTSCVMLFGIYAVTEYIFYYRRRRSRIEMEDGRFRFYNGGKKPHVDISVGQIRRLGYDQSNGNRCLFLSDYDVFRIPKNVDRIEVLDKRLQAETGLEFVSLTDFQPVTLRYPTGSQLNHS